MHLEECMSIVEKNRFLIDISDNSRSELHSHPFFELVYVLNGRVEHMLDGRTMIIGQNDYFLVNLNSTHGYRAIRGSEDFKIINCMFMPDFIDSSLSGVQKFQDILNDYLIRFGYRKFCNNPTQNVYHDKSGNIRNLMLGMFNECTEKADGYSDIIRYFLLSTIIYLVRNESAVISSSSYEIIRKTKEYISNNYRNAVSLSDIAEESNVSVSCLSRIFKKYVGMNFKDYLQKYRIEKSCRFLANSDKSIAEIADLVGYRDPAFFYKAFKSELNLTPSAYRKKSMWQEHN